VLDFAGGLVVEFNSGLSGIVLALLVSRSEAKAELDKEDGVGVDEALIPGGKPPSPHGSTPHSIPLVVLGAGLLHFGWLGFNAGSAASSGFEASRALLNTHIAAASGILGFVTSEVLWGGKGSSLLSPATWGHGKMTAIGAATGTVCGLVAITPACGYIAPMSALGLGFVASLVASLAESLIKHATGGIDVLNVFAGHGIPGLIGTLATGILARKAEGAPVDASVQLFGAQALGALVTFGVAVLGTSISWGITLALFKILKWPVLAKSKIIEDEEQWEGFSIS